MSGLIHIYCGDGKGKTTAATGLAVRASGAGKKVMFVQFLKDGNSSEIKVLKKNNITTHTISAHCGFYKDAEDKEKVSTDCIKLFSDAILKSQKDTDLLVLDEIICAIEYKIIPEDMLTDFLSNKPDSLEIVLTGRNPSEKLQSFAHYITKMQKIKHPYDNGLKARFGIEF